MRNAGGLKRYLPGLVVHAIILRAALAFGKNTYREWMRRVMLITLSDAGATIHSIKAMYPWAVLLFSGAYLVFRAREKGGGIMLDVRQYALGAAIYYVPLAAALYSKGAHVLIPLGLSLVYFALLLTALSGLNKFLFEQHRALDLLSKLQNLIPPRIYKYSATYIPRVKAYIHRKPSYPFIAGFMALLAMSAFLLIFKQAEDAEQLANIAYFSLAAGVGMELYRLIKEK